MSLSQLERPSASSSSLLEYSYSVVVYIHTRHFPSSPRLLSVAELDFELFKRLVVAAGDGGGGGGGSLFFLLLLLGILRSSHIPSGKRRRRRRGGGRRRRGFSARQEGHSSRPFPETTPRSSTSSRSEEGST